MAQRRSDGGARDADPAGLVRGLGRCHLGEWDADTPAYMARALDERLTNAPYKRLTIVPEGTHTVLLEKNRMRLFEEVQRFLDTGR